MWKKIKFFLIISAIFFTTCCSPDKNTLKLATTTSVENCGLLETILPCFEEKYKIKVVYIANGTGQAIRIAKDGNIDLLFVHDKEAEEKFILEGYGEKRFPIMKNYFMIVGPEGYDKIKGKEALEIANFILENHLLFVSRGDESGTHIRELDLWKRIGKKPEKENYFETGSSMIASLRVASEKKGFCLTDSATFLSHRKELNLVCYSAKEEFLENVYSIVTLNKKRFKKVDSDAVNKFLHFLMEGEGKDLILKYGLSKYSEPLFFPI